MNSPAIPLSDLRKLWRQARMAYRNGNAISRRDEFHALLRAEIARRTIAELRAQVERLTAENADLRASCQSVADSLTSNEAAWGIFEESMFVERDDDE